jgi:hypothetical protein
MTIDPATPEGTLTITLAYGAVIEAPLIPRRLDPVSTPEGIAQRLQNLGFYRRAITPVDPLALGLAIAAFLRKQNLALTISETDLQAALLDAHGG